MCGRFTQNLSWAEIHRLAGLIGQPRNLAPRFNIAPTTPIEVIRASDAGNELVPKYWGLVPSWWKKPLKELPATFNARAETLAERPMFRGVSQANHVIQLQFVTPTQMRGALRETRRSPSRMQKNSMSFMWA